MTGSFRQKMASLHTWTGLLVCWLLLLMFSSGTASYFRDEITLWMKPELHGAAMQPVSNTQAGVAAIQVMQQRAAQAKHWFITLPTGRTPYIRATWSGPDGKLNTALIDPATRAELAPARDTHAGAFLSRLHFDLYYVPPQTGRWIAGLCGMVLLVSLLSGVVTHRRIFRDFFTFRPGKGARSWQDAHNAVGVFALPFHMMVTYTGLVTLMFMYMPFAGQAVYKDDKGALLSDIYPSVGKPATAAGISAPLAPVGPMLEQAQRHWGGRPAGTISIAHPNDANARISVTRAAGGDLSNKQPAMQFDGAGGALLAASGDSASTALAAHGVLYGLHIARFAEPLLRWLFFISGLAGCAMVATGALLWAAKRQRHSGFGARLVHGLNIGCIAGLPIAYGAYFWANRLLPLQLAQRADREVAVFFAAWGAALLLAQWRQGRAMWRAQLACGALLLGGLPVLNAMTTATHALAVLFRHNAPLAVAAFDFTALALGMLLAVAALRLGRKRKYKGETLTPLSTMQEISK
ncbi:PepSY-associated TM helix domain-containing protein [Pseudoduganella ginsengisoli]|uniref:PepSY domain-containing protein n=1 Tax=Pseudoduganella ginsengisoli TaxID=1462440 RepID=A0A6L6PT15_9BURK|nr:PepSY-associated TM helix domain-containing protein [Pseudoduganella ginsengisoli]MTW00673.1 PepSY domain-containing protein [Pseudoduganella ginsengisoli]